MLGRKESSRCTLKVFLTYCQTVQLQSKVSDSLKPNFKFHLSKLTKMGEVDRLRIWTVFGWWSGGVGQVETATVRQAKNLGDEAVHYL